MRLQPILLVAAVLTAACAKDTERLAPEVLAMASGQSIVACGERIWVGAPVVLWSDPDGYSAYETDLHFDRPPMQISTPPDGKLRYKPGRTDPATGEIWVKPEIGTLLELQRSLDLFVLHYDVSGVSQNCFRTLHDRRALSVQFMIDVDGTIYQTLDMRDTAWHARQANSRSVGVEIAHIGAYPINEAGDAVLDRWYEEEGDAACLTLPRPANELGVRTPGFKGAAARSDRQTGQINGNLLQQYDFTRQQYDSLVKLSATLCRHFPNLEPVAPRDAVGRIAKERLSESDELAFHGILGHYHVSDVKVDPGPAFDWETFLTRVRVRLTRM